MNPKTQDAPRLSNGQKIRQHGGVIKEPSAESIVPIWLNAPDATTKAATDAQQALDAWNEARDAVARAEVEVEQAEAHDVEAVKLAVDKGKPVPARTQPAKDEALDTGRRTAEELRKQTVAALDNQAEALVGDFDELGDRLSADRGKAAARLEELSNKAQDLFHEIGTIDQAREALGHFNGTAATFTIKPPMSPERWERAVARQARRFAARRQSHGNHVSVGYSPAAIVAALASLAAEDRLP